MVEILSDHEVKKILKQMKGIEETIEFLIWQRGQIYQHMMNIFKDYSKKINVPHKKIKIRTKFPKDFKKALQSSGLDKKVHIFFNLEFKVDIIITKWIGLHISEIYNSINHIYNLILFANPPRYHIDKTIQDSRRSIYRNKDEFKGNIAKTLEKNKQWIDVFSEQRMIPEHKSPIEFYLTFQTRGKSSMVQLILRNNYSNDEFDFFEMMNYIEQLKHFYLQINKDIKKSNPSLRSTCKRT